MESRQRSSAEVAQFEREIAKMTEYMRKQQLEYQVKRGGRGRARIFVPFKSFSKVFKTIKTCHHFHLFSPHPPSLSPSPSLSLSLSPPPPQEALLPLHKKMGRVEEMEKENLKIHQLNLNLTGELEDYRHQTKTLMADLRTKEEEVASLREQAGSRGLSSSDVSIYLCATLWEWVLYGQRQPSIYLIEWCIILIYLVIHCSAIMSIWTIVHVCKLFYLMDNW